MSQGPFARPGKGNSKSIYLSNGPGDPVFARLELDLTMFPPPPGETDDEFRLRIRTMIINKINQPPPKKETPTNG